MKNRYFFGSTLLISAITMSAISLAAQSSGGDFVIVKSTIDSGGGVSAGGDFRITGTIGQHDVTNGTSDGGQFELAGGFWANSAAAVTGDDLFKDSFEDN